MTIVKIPKDRVAVLIGKDGVTKQEIKERTGARLQVDSESGDVEIDTRKVFEPVLAIIVEEIVKAIGRGFTPEKAFRLLQDDVFLKVIDMREYVGKNTSQVVRLRSRLIGSNGTTREKIERQTGADISIQGNTVAIIGEIYELDVASTAVDMLLNGAEHSQVYKFLDNKRKFIQMKRL
jgi:ribosomal RNA assembly protein